MPISIGNYERIAEVRMFIDDGLLWGSQLPVKKALINVAFWHIDIGQMTKHHLIVEHDVTMTTDRGQLTLVAEQVQKTLGKQDITIIADKGYFSRNDIKATQDLGMTANVPQTDTSGSAKKGIFNKSLFKYDKDKDLYICPSGRGITASTERNRRQP